MASTSKSTSSRIKQILGSLLLLGVILAGSVFAVDKFRRPGSMTPLEAQGMEMELPAPEGVAAVGLAPVRLGPIESRVRYTGQAVGDLEQEVTPRVTGVLLWMPLYAGDRVKRGQLLARLDTSQSAPQTADRRAGLHMAQQAVEVARRDYEQSLALIHEAHSEVGMKRGALDAARADLVAAEQERAGMQAGREAARSMIADADAQVQAAQADISYWREESLREQTLLRAGAVTQEEAQRELAQAAASEAKLRQAQARVVQVQAQIRVAQAAVQKAEAGITAAKSRIDQAQSELSSHEAHVRSEEAAATSARQKIAQAQAGADQAAAQVAAAVAARGYSEIRAEFNGVVMQRMVSPGTLVNPGQTLLKIAKIDPIRLQANVAEADLKRLRVGSDVRVVDPAESRSVQNVRLTSLAPSIDPGARTGLVEAIVPNPDGRFLPGGYVILDLSLGHVDNALKIPTRALRFHTPPSGDSLSTESVATVWATSPIDGQKDQYTAHEIPVKPGLSDGENTQILEGLKAGEQVIVVGQDDLKENDTVTPSAVAARVPLPPLSTLGMNHMGTMAGSAVPLAHPAPHTHYTCLMHPEVIEDHPGNCPKCGMKLVPKRTGGAR